MRCEAEKFTERIQKNKTLTRKDVLEMEVFLRKCVATCSTLNKTLNIYLIRKKRIEDERNDPTPHEEDRRAAKLKQASGEIKEAVV